jgi:2,4-dienoyl-CoA reductase-like NADH-dependent reductase (Old Yellow Enzyme family)
MNPDIVFEPLRFRNLTVKNRIFRSNMAGRFDFYNGSGSQARINFEERFARGGVGAPISSHVPVHIRVHWWVSDRLIYSKDHNRRVL